MSKSCETLITKINEWQKAVWELEKLSDEFLNSGDDKFKPEIDAIRQEAKRLTEEYQALAYPELPNGEKLFWPEKEVLEGFCSKNVISNLLGYENIKIKNAHTVSLRGVEFFYVTPNLSLLSSLEKIGIFRFIPQEFPRLPKSIKEIYINENKDVALPDDLINLENLKKFHAHSCNLEKLIGLPKSIEDIYIKGNKFSIKEKQRIIKEYPNAKIEF